MQGESISFFNRSSSQQPMCTFIYLATEKGKGECRDTLQHEKGQIDIQNPDWIIDWSWLNWLVGSAEGKMGDRCEWVIIFCLKCICIFVFKKKKDFRRQYHVLALLYDVCVFYLTKSVLIIMLSYPSCIMCVLSEHHFIHAFKFVYIKVYNTVPLILKIPFVSIVMSIKINQSI